MIFYGGMIVRRIENEAETGQRIVQQLQSLKQKYGIAKTQYKRQRQDWQVANLL